MGKELEQVLQRPDYARSLLLRVGISDAVPKSIAQALLAPAYRLGLPLRIHCHEGKMTDLLATLAAHKVDLVISDAPMPALLQVRAYQQLLQQSPLAFFATAGVRAQYSAAFPHCLHRAPLLLQGTDSAVRLRLLQWLAQCGVQPDIVGEFDDGALMMAFGQAGRGFFSAPASMSMLVEQQYQVQQVGVCTAVTEQFYALSVQRKTSHPAVQAIQQAGLTAATELFNDQA